MRFDVERGMWPESLLAAFATMTVAWPLTTLLRDNDWVGPAVLLVLAVAVVGSVLRSLDFNPTIVVLAQVITALGGVIWTYLGDTLRWVVVPWSETLGQARELLQQAGVTLREYAAPAPANEGVEFLIVSVLVLTAVSVDSIAVTGRSPATAGIPLAAAFLVSVSNTGEPMQPWFFAVAALAWLLMVAQQGNRLVTGWSSADRRESIEARDISYEPSGHRRVARLLAAITVLGALVIASLLPHLPPTFFTDGLARSSEGGSVGGTGQVSFTETMDVTADLADQSTDPVLRFRTASRPMQPLRVTATSEFDGTRWRPPDYQPGPPQTPLLQPSGDARAAIDGGVPSEIGELQMLSNGLRVPHMALPTPVVNVLADVPMRWDAQTGSVRLEEPVDNYTVAFLQVLPRGEVPENIGDAEADPQEWAQYLVEDPAGLDSYGPLAEEIVGDTTNDLEAASLLQRHFRSGLYAYDLKLAPGLDPDDPISHFLATRQGYCVQFATAMVMMARHEGIPARMAVGFLPGEQQANGSYSVVASDAHTWPELWIDGLGWMRFEPTPGIRTGPPPAYSQLETTTAEADPTLSNDATATPTPTAEATPAQDSTSWWEGVLDALRSAAPVLLRALAVVIVLALLTTVVAIAGRRHREAVLRSAATSQERIEGQWELLKRSLEDYGIDPPPARSPREMSAHYRQKARLDSPSGAALERATATLERARYAPVEQTAEADDATMHRDVVRVLEKVSSDLPWNMRVSAKLYPRSGVHYIRSIIRRWLRLG